MPRKPSLTLKEDKLVKKLYNMGHRAPYIANKLKVSIGTISSSIKRQKIGHNCSEAARKYHFNERFFSEINTEEKAYWLGFIYADGYISLAANYSYSIGISLAEKDRNHLKKFIKSLDGNNQIKDYSQNTLYKVGTKYSRVLLYSKLMYGDLIKQGVFEHKTNILKWPQSLPEKLENHFIRGYFDGDGCLTHVLRKKNNHRLDFAIKILSTDAFLTELYKRLKQTNITTPLRFYKRKEHQTVSSLEISGNNNVEKVLNYMYKDATIYLDRKYDKYNEFISYFYSRAIPKGIA